jgi:cell division protein FtsA
LGRETWVAGLDIGSTKTCCVVACVGDAGDTAVAGVGVAACTGVRRGAVVDIELTAASIREAVGRASSQAGIAVSALHVGVTGEHIVGQNSRGVTAIVDHDQEITEEDRLRALRQAQVIVVPPDRTILHALPRGYIVDGHEGVRHPVGMSGARLEVEAHIVTAGQTFLANIRKCVERAGFYCADMFLEPIAAGDAALADGDLTQGVCLVDIGGEVTNVAVFDELGIYYTSVLPLGGRHVTADIAQLLRVNAEEAERLKVSHGGAVPSAVAEDELVDVHQIGRSEARPFRRRALCQIMEARVREIFDMVQDEMAKCGADVRAAGGIVLIGGTAAMPGIRECAAAQMGLPVRLGGPVGVSGLSDVVAGPAYCTALGLALRAASAAQMAAAPTGMHAVLLEWWRRLRSAFRPHSGSGH